MFRKFRYRILIIAFLVLIWWLLRQPAEEKNLPLSPTEIIVPPDEIETPIMVKQAERKTVPPTPAAAGKPKVSPKASVQRTSKAKPQPADDLTRITGIGPKISTILKQAGVSTFSQLTNMQPADIKRILDEAGIRFANPQTWPEQARQEQAGKL
jgi:predicted flap endonuclease-1-like 5' DNA nuclease